MYMKRGWYGAGKTYAATMQMKIYFIHTKTRNQFYLFIFPFYTIKLGAARRASGVCVAASHIRDEQSDVHIYVLNI